VNKFQSSPSTSTTQSFALRAKPSLREGVPECADQELTLASTTHSFASQSKAHSKTGIFAGCNNATTGVHGSQSVAKVSIKEELWLCKVRNKRDSMSVHISTHSWHVHHDVPVIQALQQIRQQERVFALAAKVSNKEGVW
jgi:hypothetical protein